MIKKSDAAFDKAMEASGFNPADTRMIREVGTHACDEALKSLMRVVDTLDGHSSAAATLYALAGLRANCDALLEEATAIFAMAAAEKLVRRERKS